MSQEREVIDRSSFKNKIKIAISLEFNKEVVALKQ
jgi:hypothetical protein